MCPTIRSSVPTPVSSSHHPSSAQCPATPRCPASVSPAPRPTWERTSPGRRPTRRCRPRTRSAQVTLPSAARTHCHSSSLPSETGGESYVINGTCPRGLSFTEEDAIMRKLAYIKLHAFDYQTSGNFFWNFRTEFEPRCDYQQVSPMTHFCYLPC